MTAEVAIINPLGIALAADSAVTIQGQGQKVINSNLKLFALSKTAPVAIMLYGNNNFLNETPWEIIFKLYRGSLKDRTFANLEEYAKDFLNFLKTRSDVFTLDKQAEWYKNQLRYFFNLIKNDFINQTITLPPNEDIRLQVLENNLDIILETYQNSLPTSSEILDFETTNPPINGLVFEVCNNFFADLSLSESIFDKFIKIAKLILTNNFIPSLATGIVIAGYGEDEIYPSLVTHEVSGMYSNHLIFKRLDNKSIINSNDIIVPITGIVPFAQEDIVMSFIKGIHDNVFNQTTSLIQGTLQQLIANPHIQVSPNINSQDLVNSLFIQLNENINHYIRNEMMNPMINFVRFLPKDELALMAETLINITAFKQKMGSHMETVGGAIDVALITKGDGLIWVKRKKYFDPSMNQHFFANYFKG